MRFGSGVLHSATSFPAAKAARTRKSKIRLLSRGELKSPVYPMQVESWKWVKTVCPHCMQVVPTSCPHLLIPASSLLEGMWGSALPYASAPHPICWPLAQLQRDGQEHRGEQGSSCRMREGPLTGCVHCRTPISWFLLWVVKFNFTTSSIQEATKSHLCVVLTLIPGHNGLCHQWRFPRTIQLLIFIPFFSASFSSSFLQKRSDTYYPPAVHYQPLQGPFLPCQNGNNQEWMSIGAWEAQLWTLVGFTFRSLVWI